MTSEKSFLLPNLGSLGNEARTARSDRSSFRNIFLCKLTSQLRSFQYVLGHKHQRSGLTKAQEGNPIDECYSLYVNIKFDRNIAHLNRILSPKNI